MMHQIPFLLDKGSQTSAFTDRATEQGLNVTEVEWRLLIRLNNQPISLIKSFACYQFFLSGLNGQ